MSTFLKFFCSVTLCLLWRLTPATPNPEELFLFNRLQPQVAIDRLQQQLQLLEALPTKDDRWVLLNIELSDLCRLITCPRPTKGQEPDAKHYAQQAVDQAQILNDPVLLAKAFNALGNVLIQDHPYEYEDADKHYQHALNLLTTGTPPQLFANILVNRVQWQVDLLSTSTNYQNVHPVTPEQTMSIWQAALAATQQLPLGQEKVELMIHLSQMAGELIAIKTAPLSPEEKTILRQTAYSLLNEVRQLDASRFPREVSYANGLLGTWYQQEAGREEEAGSLLRQAIFQAQQVQAYDILYLWELQVGRLFKAKGDLKAAISAYQLARFSLKSKVRFQLVATRYQNRVTSFRETPAGQVYLELFELLSQFANQSQTESKRQETLKEAREVLEDFKQGELENYFQDDCVNPNQSVPSQDLKIDNNVAVLYPVVLADRLELLLQTPPEQFKWLPVGNITSRRLKSLVDQQVGTKLRRNKITASEEALLRKSLQELYRLLIQPVEPYIASLDTLVIIPDGILRMLPFATLYDGERYLVEKKILVTTTGLRLIDNSAPDSSSPTILLSGLTEGNHRLPYAEKEVAAIQKLFPSHPLSLLQDQQFTKTHFLEEVTRQPYSLIHIASHGQFKGQVEESFLETVEAESRLKITDFKRLAYWGDYRNQPVELLTLSACETSSGDADTALGMSGLTVTAGAKTVVGSLWRVDDLSTCYLMEAFYRQYASGVPKAKALQQAQIQLLRGQFDQTASLCGDSANSAETYRHPYYWAGFLVIGNWK